MIRNIKELLEYLKDKKVPGIYFVKETDSSQMVANVMKTNDINLLAVKKNGKYVGVISTVDSNEELASGLRPSERSAFDMMTKNVITADLDEDINTVTRTMITSGIRHIVIVDKGEWFAILSESEVLEGILKNEEEMKWVYEEYMKGHLVGPT